MSPHNKPSTSYQAKAYKCVTVFLRTVCFFKVIPYNWNTALNRVERPNWVGRLAYHLVSCISAASLVFMSVRYLQTVKVKAPTRLRVMNINWILGYMLIVIIKTQLNIRTKQIMAFTNALLEQRERMLAAEAKEKDGNKKLDLVSGILMLSTFLWVTNPPSHAIVLLDIPCAPQYISSLILECHTTVDHRPLIELVPFIIWDYFAILDMMSSGAAAWLLIFLGLTWVKEAIPVRHKANGSGTRDFDARGIQDNGNVKSLAERALATTLEYRVPQLLTRLINDTFTTYLTYFPSVLFLTTGLLIFSTIRFSYLPLHIYLVFPFCAFRCLLEVVTEMEAAAFINLASEQYLQELDTSMRSLVSQGYGHGVGAGPGPSGSTLTPRGCPGSKSMAVYLRKFRRSCGKLTCSAGSLYTLEKTIVLVCLDNCAQLVFNMLVAYPKKDEKLY